MSFANPISDDVWNSLDHDATRLHRRDRWILAVVVGVAALVMALVVTARVSGVLHPRLSVDVSTSERTGNTLLETFRVHNDDWSAETIVGVGAPMAGTRVISAEPSHLSIRSGGTRVLTLHVVITDCAAFRGSDHEHLDLRLDRWWGTASVRISLPDFRSAVRLLS